jgi:hypothetical protein
MEASSPSLKAARFVLTHHRELSAVEKSALALA